MTRWKTRLKIVASGIVLACLQANIFYIASGNSNDSAGNDLAWKPHPKQVNKSSLMSNITETMSDPISSSKTEIIVATNSTSRSDESYYPHYPPGYPILVTGLPKSGTSSVHDFFACGKVSSAHHYSKVNETAGTIVGSCYEQNMMHSNPPLENCGYYFVWSDNGYSTMNGSCFFPSIHGLQAFADAYPQGTIFMNLRNTTRWVNSFKNWGNGALWYRFVICKSPGMLPSNAMTDEVIGRWYDQHNAAVREFALAHPSLRYVEIDIESSTVAQELQTAFGVNASCWKHCVPQRGCLPVESG